MKVIPKQPTTEEKAQSSITMLIPPTIAWFSVGLVLYILDWLNFAAFGALGQQMLYCAQKGLSDCGLTLANYGFAFVIDFFFGPVLVIANWNANYALTAIEAIVALIIIFVTYSIQNPS